MTARELLIYLLIILAAAGLILYAGIQAHADESGPYYILTDVKLNLGPPRVDTEEGFERAPPRGGLPGRREQYSVIKTFNYYVAPAFADYAECRRFVETDKTFLERCGMLLKIERMTYGKNVSIESHCGARVD